MIPAADTPEQSPSNSRSLLIVDLAMDSPHPSWCGVLAGVSICSSLPCPALESMECLAQPAQWPPAPLSVPIPEAETQTVQASLLDAPMTVVLRRDAHASWMHFGDGTQVLVAADGWQIDVLARGKALSAVLWGPVLLLALARQGIYCLHASAVLLSRHVRGAIVVCAASGTGKSTLAQAVAVRGGRAVVDDLCPLRLDAQGQPRLLPRFPQLKWSSAQHWPQVAEQSLALQCIGQLQRGATSECTPLEPIPALHVLLQHTVGSRLFEPELLQAHLQFCSAVAQHCALQRRAWSWTARDHVIDPGGAMLELLQLIEPAS